MHLGIYLFITVYIFYNQYELPNAKPMVGNVRRVMPGYLRFVVSIKSINDTNPEPEQNHGCTGTLVSNKHVLTVEHGVSRIPRHRLEVIVGSYDIRSGMKFYIANILTYRQWAVSQHITVEREVNDIAMLTLTKPVPEFVEPAPLSTLPEILVRSLDALVAGWGLGTNNRIGRYLMMGTLKILTKNECKDRIQNLTGLITGIHHQYLCTSADPYVILRKGDSGGPLFLMSGELVGVNRASCPLPESNIDPRKLNIHIGIDYYKHFIISFITNF